MTEDDVFRRALSLPASERAVFLDSACEGSPQLRAAIESRLATYEASQKAATPQNNDVLGTLEFTPVPQGEKQPPSALSLPGTLAGEAIAAEARNSFDSDLLIGDRYRLRQKLGEGGMGEVWVAEQTQPIKRNVALKLIKAGMDSKAVLARFEQERQALALMDHPNIARVLDGGMTVTGQPYFVMELVDGLSLTKYCDDAMLSPKARLELFLPICRAVQHAHQKGIIHRDLKPANILITLIDGRPVPKVIDFGVAKATGEQLTDDSLATQFGAIVGTLEYMSPEQAGISAADVDTRADIYSLGVILYELLTGLRPIDGQRLKHAALAELLRIIQEEEPSKPSTRLSSDGALPSVAAIRQIDPRKLTAMLRGELDWVVMKCLEKERERRYETAGALARDIQHYLADEPVEARPPSVRYRLGKFVRRNKAPVAAASFVLLALVAGVFGTSLGLLRAIKAERLAESRFLEAETQRGLAADLAEKEAEQRQIAEKAAAAERHANSLAQKRLSQIEKTSDILGSIFASLDPSEIAKAEQPLQAILVEKLNHAVQQLNDEAVGDPLVTADIQSKLAVSLMGLGEPHQAVTLMEKVHSANLALRGLEHPDTLTSMSNLAAAYNQSGKLNLALPLQAEVLKRSKTFFGQKHPNTLASMNNLATLYERLGMSDQSMPLFEETFEICKATFGPEHPNTLSSMSGLASAYLNASKPDLAVPLYEEALKLHRSKFGPKHPATLSIMPNLAGAYFAVGKGDMAVPLLEEAIRLQNAALGENHRTTLETTAILNAIVQFDGKSSRALPLFEETLKLYRAKLGEDHPDVLALTTGLAGMYIKGGKYELAVPLLEGTLKRQKSTLGPVHPDAFTTMELLAKAYYDIKKPDLAVPLLEAVIEQSNQARGPMHPVTIGFVARLASVFQSSGKQASALPLLERIVEYQKATAGPKHPSTLKTKSHLGALYYNTGKLDSALPLLEEVVQSRRSEIGPEDLDMLTTMRNLAQLYRDVGKPAQARAVFEDLLRIQQGKDTPQRASTLASWGSLLLEEKSFVEAEKVLRECQAIRDKAEPNAWGTANTNSLLGGALLGQKKYAEAEPLLMAGYEGLSKHTATNAAVGKTRLRQAVTRLVELYTGWGKPEEAAKWKRVLEQTR